MITRASRWIVSIFALASACAAFAQPANDAPCSATNLPVNASCSNTSGTVLLATTSTAPSPSCGVTPTADVWYRVTVPASGSVTITTTAGAGGTGLQDGAMTIYTGCTAPFTEVACDLNGGGMPAITLSCRTPNEVLYIRFWKQGGGATRVTFSICATDPGLNPTTNDDPCTATALTVGAFCATVTSTTQCATSTAGVSNPSCGNYSGADVWFSMTVPASGSLTVTTSTAAGSALTDDALAVYSATNCSTPASFTQLDCNDNGTGMGALTLTCLTPGSTVYARVWAYNNAQVGPFRICAVDAGIISATNDDPCSAISLTVGATCSNTTGTNQCATNTGAVAAPSCSHYQGGDVWFKFVAPISGLVTITTSTVSGSSFTDSGIALYSATNCSTFSSFFQLGCDDDAGAGNMSLLSVGCLTPDVTYYIRVWEYDNNDIGTFNICVTTSNYAGSSPANEDPCGATILTVGTTCSSTSSTTVGSKPSCSAPEPSCGWSSVNSSDVWFKFVAPSTGIAVIQTTAGTLTDGAMALYSASSCSGPFNMIACNQDDGTGSMPLIHETGLTPGTTYYIRFWGEGGVTGTFNICVRAPAMPATTCAYAVELFDSNEDGWGNSRIETSINGAAYTNTTLASGGYDIVIFGLNSGQTFDLRYNVNGAGNQSQISYCVRLIQGGQPIFRSGPTPSPTSPTVAFHSVANCAAPSWSSQECRGGSTICGAANISSNAQNFGLMQDLDAANRGCLEEGERQGTWYIISPSAGGTIGFTITPAGNTDYDFAVWGPYSTVQCPPSNAPLRCSFAEPGGYLTGCGNGAYGASEDADGDGWVAPFNAQVGEIYLLYIDNYDVDGQQFSLTWNLNYGASLDCHVLPVELLFIDAKPSGRAVDVTWATASEHNSDHFLVERSADEATYTIVDTLDAAGESQQRIDYAFTDTDPLKGANYYRLRQVDHDGMEQLSNTAVAFFGDLEERPVLFPNPVVDALHVALDVPRDGDYQWQVLDPTGRIVAQRTMALQNGQHTLDLQLNGLRSGSYVLRILRPDGSAAPAGTFVKQ